MGILLRIFPKMQQPLEVPFETQDQFNGPNRGTWWYRDRRKRLFGPFFTRTQAQDHLEDHFGIEPYQDDDRRYWWFTDPTGLAHGPFTTMRDADVAIASYMNQDS